MPAPVVVLVGRQNVGKSSLTNALARRHAAIVHKAPGVTRDRVSAVAKLDGRPVELIDTGGLVPVDVDPFHPAVRAQVEKAVARADLVLFICDAREGVTTSDREIAAWLRRSGRPILLVANKADDSRLDTAAAELAGLGWGDPIAVSAVHRRGIGPLREALLARLPSGEPEGVPADAVHVAVVGKRNVGKSTFVNALAGEERVIVSEIPGTTRDSVDVLLRRGDRALVLTDTAGVRKRGRAREPADEFSASRAEGTLKRADAVIFLMDAREPVTELDKKIGALIMATGKPVVIGLNKEDLVPKGVRPKELYSYVRATLPALPFAPVELLSALNGKGAWQMAEHAMKLAAQSAMRVGTGEINRAVRSVLDERPPPTRGTRTPKVYYAAQVEVKPPTIRLVVNEPAVFGADYMRFMESGLRKRLPFSRVPIRLRLEKRVRRS